MAYKEPQPSAGLVLAGIGSLIFASVCAPLGGVLLVFVVLAVAFAVLGLASLMVGLWRFLSAFDAAALHRWQSVAAANNAEFKQRQSGAVDAN
jgi:hypothetical protein